MTRMLSRRGALLLPAALGGCALYDDLVGNADTTKAKLPGKRESIALVGDGGLHADAGVDHHPTLPPAIANADWPQAGGNPAHAMGGVTGGSRQLWQVGIGEGGGYRQKITATPVIAGGKLFTMDSAGEVAAFDAKTGASLWTRSTRPKRSRSSNIGGGLGYDAGALFASTGRGEVLRIRPGDGEIVWRKPLDDAARSAPTVTDGAVYVATIDERLVALRAEGGDRLWSYQAQAGGTVVLGEPAPAVMSGLVVGGFGSGDLVCLRAATGSVAWADSLAAQSGRASLIDLSAIRGLPVIANRVVYAVGLGGLMVAIDLSSGRRLWERDLASGDTPYLAGDTLFVISAQQVMAAVSVADGRVRWVSTLPRYTNPERSRGAIFWRGPLLAGGKLLVVSNTAQLLALDPQTGASGESTALIDAASLPPVAAGGIVYIVTDDGTLTAYG